MDGFKVMKLDEIVRNLDLVITCTGKYSGWIDIYLFFFFYVSQPQHFCHSIMSRVVTVVTANTPVQDLRKFFLLELEETEEYCSVLS